MISVRENEVLMTGDIEGITKEFAELAKSLHHSLVIAKDTDFADFIMAMILTDVTMPGEERAEQLYKVKRGKQEHEITKEEIIDWLSKHLN